MDWVAPPPWNTHHILEDELFQENTITIVVSHDNEWNDYVDQIVKL